MARIVAVTSCPTGIAHTFMAAEALAKVAQMAGHTIAVETQGSVGTKNPLSEDDIDQADVVILAVDTHVTMDRFAGKAVYETSTSQAIRNTRNEIDAALALAGVAAPRPDAAAVAGPPPAAPAAQAAARPRRLVGITSCPTGIAHTFMAAEALKKAATGLGHSIKVETQGSVGSQNTLTPVDIAAADAVVIAADTKVDTSRFGGKPLYMTGTNEAMQRGREVIETALAQPAEPESTVAGAAGGDGSAGSAGYAAGVARAKAQRSAQRTGPYKHLMTGVSYMLPVVVAGGLSIALAFAVGGINAAQQPGSLGWALNQIGGATAFSLFVAVLSAYIAYSIADRPGIAPGLIGGMLAQTLGAGFLGGIVSGFIAGYLTRFLADIIKLPMTLEGLKPILILPFVSTVVVGLLMIFVIGPPVQAINSALTEWLKGMQGANALLLGALLGAMMGFDMGGPVNKSAYTFAVGLLGNQVYAPMAAVMAAGMTPPLGLALAAFLFRDRFDLEEREAAAPALVLGLAFITEGAIPFAAKDPLRVIPSLMLGSAVAGGLSMLFGCQLLVPHGGIFAIVIPGAAINLPAYLLAIVIGAVVTGAAVAVLKALRPAPSAVAARRSEAEPLAAA
jgi:PTS system fructose-specific IIC component